MNDASQTPDGQAPIEPPRVTHPSPPPLRSAETETGNAANPETKSEAPVANGVDPNAIVQVKNLRKSFGSTHAVDDISFSFDRGQIFGFVGPNGAGKTTTMRVLSTLEEPSSGAAYIDGHSVVQHPERVRKLVGYVPDLLPTHSDINVEEYLDFFARAYGLRGEERDAAVHGVMEFTNLLGIKEKLLKALSKGMKQRVNLGRALIHDPDVLILDEPAAGLDPRARVELRELLSLLAFEQNKAVFISSHILTELTEICNGVVIIEQGRLLETGTIDEVTDRARNITILRLRALDPMDELRRSMLELPHVTGQIRTVGESLEVEIEGGDEAAADILTELNRRGHRICEFRPQAANLEDIFMSITEGKVQ